MKDSLLLPLRFIIVLLAVLVPVGLLSYLYEALAILSVRHSADTVEVVAGRLVQGLPGIFLGAALVSAVNLLFSIVERPGVKPLSILLVPLLLGSSLYWGLFGFGLFAAGREKPAEAPVLPYSEGFIHKTRDGAMWVHELEGTIVRGVLFRSATSDPAISAYPEALYLPDKDALRIIATGSEYGLGHGAHPLRRRHPFQQQVLDPLVRDLGDWAWLATPTMILDVPRLATVLGLSLFVTGLYTFARGARWPLLNLVVILSILRGVMLLPAFLSRPPARTFVAAFFRADLLPYVLPAILGVLAILSLAVNLFRSPLNQWRRETGYE